MFSKNVKISNSNKEKNVCVKIKYAKKYISKKVHKKYTQNNMCKNNMGMQK